MDSRGCEDEALWVFEYVYRDAGNWKTHGALLLTGLAGEWEPEIRKCLEWGEQFVAEQVGVPPLCSEHFAATGEGPTDLDHAYHEFVCVRPATAVERGASAPAGLLTDLLDRMRAASGRWDVRLSPNCDL